MKTETEMNTNGEGGEIKKKKKKKAEIIEEKEKWFTEF